jgi:hypothetical protein
VSEAVVSEAVVVGARKCVSAEQESVLRKRVGSTFANGWWKRGSEDAAVGRGFDGNSAQLPGLCVGFEMR